MANEREQLLTRAESDAEEGRTRAQSGQLADAAGRSGGGVGEAGRRARALGGSTHGATSDDDGSDDSGVHARAARGAWGTGRTRRVMVLIGSAALAACACGAAFGTAKMLRARGTSVGTTNADDASVASSSAASGDPKLAGLSKKEFADSIAHAVEAVRQEERDNTSSDDDEDSTHDLRAVQLPEDTWHTPTHLVARPRDNEDRASLKVTLSKLLTSHDVELVSQNVRITAGIDPKLWPEGLDRTVYALKSVFANLGGDYLHPDFTLLKGLDWIEAPNSRDLDGKIAGAWAPLERHVGLLFGHFYQWQLAKDAGNKATIIIDNNGLDPVKLAVPVTSLGAIVDHAPTDFDVILLNAYSNSTGAHVVEQFPDHKGNTVQMTTWREPGRTGLSTYIISRDFPDKVFKYAALKGAGYFDSWIVDDLCTHKVLNDKGEIVGTTSSEATQPLLNCYHVSGVLAPEMKTSSKSLHSHSKHGSSVGSLGDTDFGEEDYDEGAKTTTAAASSKASSSSSSSSKTQDELPAWVTAADVPLKSAKSKSSKHSKSEDKDLKVDDLFTAKVPEAKLGAVQRTHVRTSANEFVSASKRERAIEQSALLRRRHDAIAERIAERDRVQEMLNDIHALHARGVYAGDEGFSIASEHVERERRARAAGEVEDALQDLM